MDPRNYGYGYHFSEEEHKIPGLRHNRELFPNPNSSRLDMAFIDALRDQFEATSFACPSSSFSLDGTNSETLSLSFDPSEHGHGDDDGSSSTDGSSPLGWPPSRRTDHCPCPPTKQFCGPGNTLDTTDKKEKELSEVEMMKEKFAKLLLGEDMSGGGKGVSSALAISNAITNLAASVFGEIWRLEPLSLERKSMWKREMDWLLSVADHIVELVPSVQTFPDGTKFEVMITRPRADLHVNLPALRKLDTMLLESLDNFSEAEFWYIDNGVTDDDNNGLQRLSIQRNEEKWWLPVAKVPSNGLSEIERKKIQHQKDCIAQILKAALAINSQVLSEMEIPEVYWNALPKNGKSSLGEALYKIITSESFSPEAFLSACDLSNEHKTVDLANRLEAAIHVWQRRRPSQGPQKYAKESRQHAKSSWGMVKDFVSDAERREFLADRAEAALLFLRQKFPNLRQSLLDMTKIQYNKDIGQSILESYSRVLESLASNIVSRIDDILYVDEITRRHGLPEPPRPVKTRVLSQRRGYSMNFSLNHSLYGTPFGTPSVSPTPSPSPRRTPNSPLNSGQNGPSFSDFICYSYETEPDNYQAYKKFPQGHVSKGTTLSSRSLNSSRSPSIYPLHDL